MALLRVWKDNISTIFPSQFYLFLAALRSALAVTCKAMGSWWFSILILISLATIGSAFYEPGVDSDLNLTFYFIQLYCSSVIVALSLAAARPSLPLKDKIYQKRLCLRIMSSALLITITYASALFIPSDVMGPLTIILSPWIAFFILFYYDEIVGRVSPYRVSKSAFLLMIRIYPLVFCIAIASHFFVKAFLLLWRALLMKYQLSYFQPIFLEPIPCIIFASLYALLYSFFTQNTYRVVSSESKAYDHR